MGTSVPAPRPARQAQARSARTVVYSAVASGLLAGTAVVSPPLRGPAATASFCLASFMLWAFARHEQDRDDGQATSTPPVPFHP